MPFRDLTPTSEFAPLLKEDLAWCIRGLPKTLREALYRNPKIILAGGYIRSRVTREPVKDIDLFAPSQDIGATFLLGLPEVAGDKSKLHKTQNALTVKGVRPSIQMITRWTYTDLDSALQSFDYTLAQAGIQRDPTGEGWIGRCSPTYYADLAAKRLVYTSPVRNEDAGGSILRMLKFYQRGYRIPVESLAAVTARLMAGVDLNHPTLRGGKATGPQAYEAALAHVIKGLLREVDPNLNLDDRAYMTSLALPRGEEAPEDLDNPNDLTPETSTPEDPS